MVRNLRCGWSYGEGSVRFGVAAIRSLTRLGISLRCLPGRLRKSIISERAMFFSDLRLTRFN